MRALIQALLPSWRPTRLVHKRKFLVREGILQALHSSKIPSGQGPITKFLKFWSRFYCLCTFLDKNSTPTMTFFPQGADDVLEGAFSKKMDAKPSLYPTELLIVIHKPQNGVGSV
jgi:hypothetical protein